MGEAVIRVVLGHRGTLVRGALAAVLAKESDLDVVAELDRSDDVLPSVAGAGRTWWCSIHSCPARSGSRICAAS